ncbi:hypothetical protein AUP68_08398 [Ilyonectria robusta]
MTAESNPRRGQLTLVAAGEMADGPRRVENTKRQGSYLVQLKFAWTFKRYTNTRPIEGGRRDDSVAAGRMMTVTPARSPALRLPTKSGPVI